MREKHFWVYDLLLIAVLLVAAYLRLTGVDWGGNMHQHPDELFLSGVLGNMQAHICEDPLVPVTSCPPEKTRWLNILEYFDTDTSTINPYNRGQSFFVYGTLPLFIVRYAAELTGQIDAGALKLLGRQFSALADLFTILLLYFIVLRVHGRRVGLLASLFSALAVMQIQQSHFFTTDLFTNLFMFLAIWFAVEIVQYQKPTNAHPVEPQNEIRKTQLAIHILRHPLFLLSLGFGFALGMAMASKINAAALAILLPGAFIIRYSTVDKGWQAVDETAADNPPKLVTDYWSLVVVFIIAGAVATVISFRIFQPYAFDGLGLNPQWISNIQEQRVQASGDADLPWNLQWARRSHLYSFTNLTVWGLGLPLGILAWAGFLLMGWRILKGEWRYLLLWGWTAFYFLWQSLQFNPTMRYQLPVYPLLAMMAAWAVFELAGWKVGTSSRVNLPTVFAGVLGITVVALTTVWAFAFQSIYLRPETRMTASRWMYQNIPGAINVQIETEDGSLYSQPIPFPTGGYVQSGTPYLSNFTAYRGGQVTGVLLGHATDPTAPSATVNLSISSSANPEVILAQASATVDSTATKDIRGASVLLTFDKPVPVDTGILYTLKFETSGQSLMLSGASIANETDYDWGLPFRVDNYDGFGGIYRGDLILQVYWDDNLDKFTRLTDSLNQADYIIIPTNHQYGQITRLPERFPLTTLYYRELLGCPADKDIIWCYRVAEPGQFEGTLGFELVQVFESYPTLGPLVINDQPAEEAFTFYDHPKVLIFKKSADYNPAMVSAILGAVDLTNVVHLTPRQANSYKDLMLPADRLAGQRAGGTWSELFDYDWLQNKYPALGVVIWYLFIFALGLVVYPITRLALPGIRQFSYPLSRVMGLALLAWLSWMGGSLGIPYTRVSIGAALALITVAGLSLGWMRRDELKAEWNSNRRFYLIVEILFVSFFIMDLLIRLGNPDLWHPSKGGERPMDFSYFNAVLKSTSFPPYDPWFAGGYINYYYYGFVLVGTPVKLLGIVPSIAYNFILPTLFALVAAGAFTIGWNLVESQRHALGAVEGSQVENRPSTFDLRLISGLAAPILLILLGNLGTVQMLFQAFQRMAAPGGTITDANVVQRWIWALKGLTLSFSGTPLPIGRGEWYWNPSRVIPPGPGNEITEFPLFTFLYSDLHAHMIVLPLALFVVAWTVSFVKARAKLSRAEWLVSFFAGGLMLGALYPTNLSDIYTYLLLALIALVYVFWVRADVTALRRLASLPDAVKRLLMMAVSVAALTGISFALYQPYRTWYSQAYGAVDPWTGPHTPFWSYFTHWGLFLFIIAAWMAWETREWMANTPASALSKLRPCAIWIEGGLAAILIALVYFAVKDVPIGWLALPMAAWAGILLLRHDMPDEKRMVLFWIGTALVVTIVVELVTVRGDIGRMNTVFKFYLQAWLLFSLSAAAAIGWLFNAFPQWSGTWRNTFQIGLSTLLVGAFLFTITASTDKINDRMNPQAPHTLDSMTYMNHTQHWDGNTMDLSEDYRSIRWMQDYVQGSPVIVEANCTEYRWCTRFTIYTGLPGVAGWNWHQRQQRALIPPNLITDRVDEIGIFYSSPDIELARAFLKKYHVEYIVVGQLERNVYPIVDGMDGLAKFEQYNGQYWRSTYRDLHTVIYEVLP